MKINLKTAILIGAVAGGVKALIDLIVKPKEEEDINERVKRDVDAIMDSAKKDEEKKAQDSFQSIINK